MSSEQSNSFYAGISPEVVKEQKILSKALRILTQKMWFANAFEERLHKHFPGSSDQIKEVVQMLQGQGYLNDVDNGLRYIEYRLSTKPQGVFLLKRDLLKKGFDPQLLDVLLREVDIDELEYAKKAFEIKFPGLDPTKLSFENKKKAFQFLKGRGFPFSAFRFLS